jgi:Cu(I)/Ag(I) efflux system membrane fusion protein
MDIGQIAPAVSLHIPKQAVIRTGKQDRVVVKLKNGVYKSVEVRLGKSNSERIEVLAGLKNDDEVVISAQFLIDSESSKTSDFIRMSPMQSVEKVRAKGVITQLNATRKSVVIAHGEIDALDWPAMVMPFDYAQAIEPKLIGQNVWFDIIKEDGKWAENIRENAPLSLW